MDEETPLPPALEGRSGIKQAATETAEQVERLRYTLTRVRDWLDNTNSWVVMVPGIGAVQSEIDAMKAEVDIALNP